MATTHMVIPAINGRPHSTNTPDLKVVLDTNLSKWVAEMAQGVQSDLHFCMYIPGNLFTGNVTCKVRWRANATTGDAALTAWWAHIANAGNQAAALSTQALITTTDATANDINETSFTLGTGSAADRVLCFHISRVTTSDTLTPALQILDVVLSYQSDPWIQKNYVWLPANCFAIPAASGAAMGYASISSSNQVYPHAILFRDGVSDYADACMTLPSNYLGGATLMPVWVNQSAGVGHLRWSLDNAVATVGGSGDPALSGSPTLWTTTLAGANTIVANGPQALPTAPAAGEDLHIRLTRLGADGADDLAASAYLLGCLLTYNVYQRDPATIRLDPASGAQPANAATILQAGSNVDIRVGQFADALTQSLDYWAQVPPIYSAGGTLRVRWQAAAASGNAVWRVSTASPAAAAASDPTITQQGSDIVSACAGSGLVNEFTCDISSGLVAADAILVRLTRVGGDGADTLAAAAQVLDVSFESSITA